MRLINIAANLQEVHEGNTIKLFHYGALVCIIEDAKVIFTKDSRYSRTTAKHVKRFIDRHNLTFDNKAFQLIEPK